MIQIVRVDDTVFSIWPDDIRDLALFRKKLETDPTEVAEVIDYLRNKGRIEDEPKVPPEGIAKLPPEKDKVEANEPPHDPSPPHGTSMVEEGSTTPEASEPSEEPSVAGIMECLKPILAKGTTMRHLRRKVGSEKGSHGPPWWTKL